MNNNLQQSSSSDYLQSIYQTIQKLKSQQKEKPIQQPIEIHQERLTQVQLALPLNRSNSIVEARTKLKPKSSIVNPIKTIKPLQSKKSRIIHFIATNSNLPSSQQNTNKKYFEEDIKIFTPLRAVESHSELPQNHPNRTTSTSRNTLSRQTSLRFSKNHSNKSRKENKYLRKGTRVKQLLLKHMQCPQEKEQQQLAYLKQYDMWVPSSLANVKKQQLQYFLKIMVGGKRKDNQKDLRENGKFKMIYL